MKHLLLFAGLALAARCSTPAPGAVTHINDLVIHDPHPLVFRHFTSRGLP